MVGALEDAKDSSLPFTYTQLSAAVIRPRTQLLMTLLPPKHLNSCLPLSLPLQPQIWPRSCLILNHMPSQDLNLISNMNHGSHLISLTEPQAYLDEKRHIQNVESECPDCWVTKPGGNEVKKESGLLFHGKRPELQEAESNAGWADLPRSWPSPGYSML